MLRAGFGEQFSPALVDRPRVLLVDDFPLMLDRAASVLAATCTIVGAVPDGEAALEAAATLKPEVIVLDISLPGMNGFDVAARLKTNGCTAAIVILTLHDEEVLIKTAQTIGCLGYVVKRRLEAELVKAVLEAWAGRPFVSKTVSRSAVTTNEAGCAQSTSAASAQRSSGRGSSA